MQFRDFIVSKATIDELVSTTRNEVLAEMTDALIAARTISPNMRQGVLTALIDRENHGSTGIGGGLAIPHAKHPGIAKLIGLFARSREGVQFDSLDGEPAHLFFLLLSSQESYAQHLETLGYISKHLSDDIFRSFLLRARDKKENMELLEEADQKALSI